MTAEELKTFNWTEVSFGEQVSRKILILVCAGKNSAENFLNILREKEFDLNLILKKETGTYTFQINFKSGEVLGMETVFTESNYPPVKWAKNQQLTHLTTAYRDEQGKLQLSEYFHPLENQVNLN